MKNYLKIFTLLFLSMSCSTLPMKDRNKAIREIQENEEERQIDPQLHEAYDLDKDPGSIDNF